MRIWTSARNLFGLLAIAASLALASPGVNVVQAGSEAEGQPGPANAATCEAPVEGAAVEAVVRDLRRGEAARPPGAGVPGDHEIVTLNTRGYNYGPHNLAPPETPEQPPSR